MEKLLGKASYFGVVDNQTEATTQFFGSFAAHNHADDEDFKVFHEWRFFYVNHEIERNNFFFPIYFDVRFLHGMVDSVMNIIGSRVGILNTCEMNVGFVGNEYRRGHGVDSGRPPAPHGCR